MFTVKDLADELGIVKLNNPLMGTETPKGI